MMLNSFVKKDSCFYVSEFLQNSLISIHTLKLCIKIDETIKIDEASCENTGA